MSNICISLHLERILLDVWILMNHVSSPTSIIPVCGLHCFSWGVSCWSYWDLLYMLCPFFSSDFLFVFQHFAATFLLWIQMYSTWSSWVYYICRLMFLIKFGKLSPLPKISFSISLSLPLSFLTPFVFSDILIMHMMLQFLWGSVHIFFWFLWLYNLYHCIFID